jgi:phage terminase large subunit-like protein
MTVLDHTTLERWQRDPVSFISEVLRNPKTGRPFELLDAQKQFFAHAWQRGDDGRLLYPEQCFGAIKKTGKTGTAAMHGLVTLLVYSGRYAEAYCVSNDMEQAVGRVFTAIKQICEASPLLRREANITASRITFPQTGAFCQAIGGDYASAAGAHPSWTSADELWGFVSERSYRLYEECVPVPTVPISCRLVTTHAGFANQSDLLSRLYQRGMALPQIAPDLHAGDGCLFHWSTTPLAPWQSESWLAQMRRELRPTQYLRMIENRFVTAENAFIEPSAWDRCVQPSLGHLPSNPLQSIWVGVDASTKHDASAVVGVSHDSKTDCVRLAYHRVFQPSPDDPLDFESTIEATVLDLSRRFSIVKCLFDPYQMAATSQRLARAGVAVEEYPQTVGNMTAASQQLYELVQGQRLILYPDAMMRLAAIRTVAVETPRGFRITKDKAAHKIDSIVALALAAYAACRGHADSTYTLAPFDPNFVDLDADPAAAGPPPTAAEQASQNAANYVRSFCAANGLLV